jgi:2-dehydropantoate 2-reductase
MRYVILGAGAIGGAMGGKLAKAGRDVVLIARGAHLDALQREGLELRDPDLSERLQIAAYGSPAAMEVRAGDCVLLATKTQQSEGALDDLRAAAEASPQGDVTGGIAVVCAQNGVENERIALRRFPNVYGMRVILPGSHLEPGVVEIATSPVYGLLEVGRYPAGVDELTGQLAADLVSAGFDARATADVMSFKYLKLLSNLGNALQAASGTELSGDLPTFLLKAARAEARACYAAAGIELADEDAEAVRRRLRGGTKPVQGKLREAGSSWQSLQRGTGNIEADYLNGEIVLLGRLHGIPTPVNERLQQVANRLARDRRPPGSISVEEVADGLDLARPATP